jgi:hypothetical protein
MVSFFFTSIVKHGDWLNETVRPRYDVLFEGCDDTAKGQAACCEIINDLLEKKKDLEKGRTRSMPAAERSSVSYSRWPQSWRSRSVGKTRSIYVTLH